MKYYTQFLDKRNNEFIEPCGSDSVFVLDGRNSILNMKIDSKIQAKRLKNVQSYKYFRVMRGAKFSQSKPVTGVISI